MCGPTNPPCRSLSHTHNPIRIDDVLFSLSQTGCIIRSTAAHCCQNGHHKSSGQNKASDSCLHFQYNIRQKIQNFTVPKTDDIGCGQDGQPCPPNALRLRGKTDFSLPEEFNARGYFAGIYGPRVYPDMKAETVILKAYGMQPKYFKSLPLHQSQEIIEETPEYTVFKNEKDSERNQKAGESAAAE